MFKKTIALAIGLLLSFSASAGYVQYDLSGGVTGFVVQHDDDQSIAFYSLTLDNGQISTRLFPSGPFGNLTDAWTSFDHGPTNFQAYDRLTEVYVTNISVVFSQTGTAGTYTFASDVFQYRDSGFPYPLPPLQYKLTGTATQVAVDPQLAAHIDAGQGYPDGIARIVPRLIEVPEPAGLALLAIGALGALGASRRVRPVRRT